MLKNLGPGHLLLKARGERPFALPYGLALKTTHQVRIIKSNLTSHSTNCWKSYHARVAEPPPAGAALHHDNVCSVQFLEQ
jgi:hypothetical protein